MSGRDPPGAFTPAAKDGRATALPGVADSVLFGIRYLAGDGLSPPSSTAVVVRLAGVAEPQAAVSAVAHAIERGHDPCAMAGSSVSGLRTSSRP